MVVWASIAKAVVSRAAPAIAKAVSRSPTISKAISSITARAAPVISKVTARAAPVTNVIRKAASPVSAIVNKSASAVKSTASSAISIYNRQPAIIKAGLQLGAPAVAVGAIRAITDKTVQSAITPAAPQPQGMNLFTPFQPSVFKTPFQNSPLADIVNKDLPAPAITAGAAPSIIEQAKQTWNELPPEAKGALLVGGAAVAGLTGLEIVESLAPKTTYGGKNMGFWDSVTGTKQTTLTGEGAPRGAKNVVMLPDGSVKKLVSVNAKIQRKRRYGRRGGASMRAVKDMMNQMQQQQQNNMMLMIALTAGRR